jgi:hypothetical protein
MEPYTPPCTYMDSVGSDGGGALGVVMTELLESYRKRLDVWRLYYLNGARRWNFVYYLLLCISICASTAAGVIIANLQDTETDTIAKWAGVGLTLVASTSSSLLGALHPLVKQKRAREQAGIAVKLRGMVFVILAGHTLMNNTERQIAVDAIVEGYANFIDGSVVRK